MRSAFELHGLSEEDARKLAKTRRDEALKKLEDARAEFDDWDEALRRLQWVQYSKWFYS